MAFATEVFGDSRHRNEQLRVTDSSIWKKKPAWQFCERDLFGDYTTLIRLYVPGSINSHYFHIIGDKLINPIPLGFIGPQYKDSVIKGGMSEFIPSPIKTRQPNDHGDHIRE